MKKLFLFTILFISIRSYAQKDAPDTVPIRLIAKAYGDSIVLRWAPASPAAWQMLNGTGYKILRMQKTSVDGNWSVLQEKLVPQSLDMMKKTLDRNNRFAAIAAQALYGKNLYAQKKGLAPAVAQQQDILNDRFALCLQAADYSSPVAKAIALGWTDKNVTQGEAYVYKIVPASPIKELVIAPLSLIVVNVKEEEKRPNGLLAIGGDRKAELHWPRNQEENYSGYQVEFSEDGKLFKAMQETPYFTSLPDTAHMPADSLVQAMTDMLRYHHIYIDSLKNNYQSYYYRIRGINSFGEWSGYSDVVVVSGRDLTPPSSVLLATPEPAGKKTIKLTWAKPVKEQDLKGFYVYRSRQVDAGYSLINAQALPASATSFADNEAYEYGPNFYIVAAVDTAGNHNASIPVMGILPDTTAPAIPKALTANIDKEGLVHLSWQANTDEDMKGYKIYFSHDASQPFVQVTLYPTPDNNFTDSISLKTLTKKIYYRVVAVDQHNNHSEYSSILELKKPDIIPPTPPVILNATVSANGVLLDFSNSASTDAVRYVIVRKEGNGDWKNMVTLKHGEASNGFSFRDTTIKYKMVYEYAARTIDEDSLQSSLCTPVRVQLKGTEELPAISFTRASYNAGQNAVILQWNYDAGEPHYFVVYRSLAGAPLERYRTLEKGAKEWKDLQVDQIAQGYQYAIQAVYDNNAKITRLPEGTVVRK